MWWWIVITVCWRIIPKDVSANAIVKGLRAVCLTLSMSSRWLLQIKSFTMTLKRCFSPLMGENMFLSSSVVKEIASFGGDITGFVPKQIQSKITDRLYKPANNIDQ